MTNKLLTKIKNIHLHTHMTGDKQDSVSAVDMVINRSDDLEVSKISNEKIAR